MNAMMMPLNPALYTNWMGAAANPQTYGTMGSFIDPATYNQMLQGFNPMTIMAPVVAPAAAPAAPAAQ
jgi:hypothetical protein